ncbi:YdcH family protein [Erythrobacter longus]|nr:DUF465 domain-containing protein [Erythrobacter longus]
MSAHTPHELHEFFGRLPSKHLSAPTLAEEFPHDAGTLTRLKLTDNHFCSLSERYHALNRSIHRIEAQVETTSDAYVTQLKKQRLALLDDIALIVEIAERKWAQGDELQNGVQMDKQMEPSS